jgi:hypothetical protein
MTCRIGDTGFRGRVRRKNKSLDCEGSSDFADDPSSLDMTSGPEMTEVQGVTVNGVLPATLPPGVVTRMAPVVAPAGILKVRVVSALTV